MCIKGENEKARMDIANKKARFDAATEKAHIEAESEKARIDAANENACINMESQKQAVAAELKLVQKLRDLNKQSYIHKRHVSLAADQQTLNDMDVEYHVTRQTKLSPLWITS